MTKFEPSCFYESPDHLIYVTGWIETRAFGHTLVCELTDRRNGMLVLMPMNEHPDDPKLWAEISEGAYARKHVLIGGAQAPGAPVDAPNLKLTGGKDAERKETDPA